MADQIAPIGERLRELRGEIGLTQEALADRSGVSLDLIKKLEQGRRKTARLTSLTALAQALDVPLSWLFDERSPPTGVNHGDDGEPAAGAVSAFSPGTTDSADIASDDPLDALTRVDRLIAGSDFHAIRGADYHQLVKDLVEWARRMQRRDVLQWLSWAAAAAAAAPVFDGLDVYERERAIGAFVTPRRVDNTVIDHIEAVLWRCMRQDDTLGPQAALDTVLAQRGLVRGLLPEAPAATKDRLLSVYADISGFAGWLSFDLGNYVAAIDYYETARAATHEAHNTELGALILCNMSQTATWRGQARVGVDHALAAQGWANQTDDLPLRSYAYDVAARAYALDGQHRPALEAIDRARTALDNSPADRPTLVYFYGPGQLASTESNCHLQLGDAGRAADAALFALDAIGPTFTRNLAMVSLRLGSCRLRARKPDVAGAAEAIAAAAGLAAHNRSIRLVERLRHGWRELKPWQDEPEVRDVRDQLVAFGLT